MGDEFDAQTFFDPGYNVLDANVLPLGEGYLMAFKDERGGHEPDAKHKAIRIARAQNAIGPWQTTENSSRRTSSKARQFFAPNTSS